MNNPSTTTTIKYNNMCAITMNMSSISTSSSIGKRTYGESSSCPQPKRMRILMSSLPDRMLKTAAAIPQECSPDSIVAKYQPQVSLHSYNTVPDFFHAPTQAEIDAYDHDVLAAIRTQDMDTLKQYHAQGRPLKCSNKFGESLLHMACRKGMLQVTTFLVKDAQVPFAVCDDYGRTPLHDACWAHTTNFELIDLILTDCPDLLYIKDKRGNTPLSYLRKDKWAAWNQYLNSKPADFFKPRQL